MARTIRGIAQLSRNPEKETRMRVEREAERDAESVHAGDIISAAARDLIATAFLRLRE
jgi:hypothetical protein